VRHLLGDCPTSASYNKYKKSERKNTYMMDPRLKISVGRNNNRSFAANKRSKEITSVQIQIIGRLGGSVG